MTTLNITAEDLERVKALTADGKLSDAWGILANNGDSYAWLAQYVVMSNPTADGLGASVIAMAFRKMVRLQWDKAAGPNGANGSLADSALFIEVGKRHLSNYVELLEKSFAASGTYVLPDTIKIESSYRESVTHFGLPSITAIDGIFSVIDTSLGAGPGRDWSWAEFMNLGNWVGGGPAWPSDRIKFNSQVFQGDFTATEAFITFARDMVTFASDMGADFWLPWASKPAFWVARTIDSALGYKFSSYLDSRVLSAGLMLADPTFEVSAYNDIMSAMSVSDDDSAQKFLSCIGDAIGLDFHVQDRAGFFLALTRFGEWYAAQSESIQLASMVGMSVEDIAAHAGNIAYRYALKKLNPFVIYGIDYSRFNTNGELDLVNPETETGSLSEAWITDRAAMLAWKIKLNIEDFPSSIANPYHDAPNAFFKDMASGEEIVLGNPPMGQLDRRFILFGSNDGDVLNGGAQDDRFYGADGNDNLTSGGGVDYLEGGAGNDTLNAGDGNDIAYGGADADKIDGGNGDDTLYGDAFNPASEAGGSDTLIGESGDDTLYGGGGDDVLYGDAEAQDDTGGLFGLSAGSDILYGGLGTDQLYGGAGADTLIGGADADSIDGGSDNDLIYGDSESTTTKVGGNDTLTGGAGDDQLRGGAGADALFGGNGYDQLFGGLGDDLLDGGDNADVLQGSEGYDLYRTTNADTVVDTDGRGRISFKSSTGGMYTLCGGRRDEGETYYTSADQRFRYYLAGSTLSVAMVSTGESVTVSNFHNKQLGIYLDKKPNPPGQPNPKKPPPWSPPPYDPDRARPPRRCDPLALDLNRNGEVDTLSMAGTMVMFDITQDGIPERTGWIAHWDGLLVQDKNGDGRIQGDEVFGTPTVNGFDVLRNAGDANQDGVINALDPIYSHLRIWQDADEDAVTDAGELTTLAERDISEIGLTAAAANYDTNGNVLSAIGHYNQGGTSQLIANIDLQFSPTVREVDPAINLGLDSVETLDADIFELPWLRGYGQMKSLHLAYRDDPSLKEYAKQLVAEGRDSVFANFDTLLAKWSGLEQVLIDARVPLPHALSTMDKAWIMETAVNRELFKGAITLAYQTDSTVELASNYVEEQYAVFRDHMLTLFAAQAFLGAEMQGAWYSLLSNTFIVDDPVAVGAGLGSYVKNAVDFKDAAFVAKVLNLLRSDGAEIDRAAFEQASIGGRYSDLVLRVIDGDIGMVQFGTVWLDPSAQNILVSGTDRADMIVGSDGKDILAGGHGNDTLTGYSGADTYLFNAGDGHDAIEGENGDPSQGDKIVFGPGLVSSNVLLQRQDSDLVITFANNTEDSLRIRSWFSGANYQVERFEFADGVAWDARFVAGKIGSPSGTSGDDAIYGTERADTLDGMDGRDWLYGDRDGDLLIGGAGEDDLYGEGGNDTLQGGADHDFLAGGAGNDVLDGGEGGDFVDGGIGNDTILFGRGSGQDTVVDSAIPASLDTVRFDAGVSPSDIVVTRDAQYLYVGIAGTDDRLALTIGYTGDIGGVEQFVFDDGTVWSVDDVEQRLSVATETVGADEIFGSVRADTISGGMGDDTLDGAQGDDRLLGGAGNDSLLGGEGHDVIDGGAGDDIVCGGSGGDTYLFGRGDGADTVEDYTEGYPYDTVRFKAGVLASEVRVLRLEQSLVLSIAGTGDSLKVSNWFPRQPSTQVRTVMFDDGTVWDSDYLAQLSMTGTANADCLVSDESADTLLGLGGADEIYGGDGDDTLDGGAGNDTLDGGAGNDVILFGRGYGNDIARPPYINGEDVVKLTGTLTPADIEVTRDADNLYLAIKGTSDRLKLQDYFASGMHVAQIVFPNGTVWRNPESAIFGSARGDTILGGLGRDEVYGAEGNDALSGGAGDDFLYGEAGDDSLTGGSGDDQLDGGAGNDVYVFDKGFGIDYINDQSGVNAVVFGVDFVPADIRVTRENDLDLVLLSKNSGDRIIVQRWFNAEQSPVSEVRFADGTVWSAAMLRTLTYTGTSEGEYLYGNEDANLIDGKGGGDVISGGGGADSYRFERAYGTLAIANFGRAGSAETLQLGAGIAASDLDLWRVDESLVIALRGTKDRITLENWFLDANNGIVAFADGSVWNADALLARVKPKSGTSGDDQIWGGDSDDIIVGGAGADRLQGGRGNDTYRISRGDGRDWIEDVDESVGNIDTIEFDATLTVSDISVARQGEDLVLSVNGSQDNVVVSGWFASDKENVERVRFADGTTWALADIVARALLPTPGDDSLIGGAGAETIAGLGGQDYISGGAGDDNILAGSGDDTIVGGAGSDTLDGWTGNDRIVNDDGVDVIVFGRGYGADVVEKSWNGDAAIDRIDFSSDVSRADLRWERSGADLLIRIKNTNDSLVLQGWFYSELHRHYEFHFADGSQMSSAEIAATVAIGSATSAADTLYGTDGSDTISANDGADRVYAGTGDDLVHGDAGEDFLDGGEGNDTLDGGSGDDQLSGGAGQDSFLFNRGGGNDAVTDDQAAFAGDIVSLGSSISPGDVIVSRQQGNLVLHLRGSDDSFTINNWFYAQEQGSEPIVRFADGTVWSSETLKMRALSGSEHPDNLYGTAGNDTLAGHGGSDDLVGDAGNDWLDGGDDDDMVTGGIGNDTLIGGYGDDMLSGGVGADRLIGAAGNDALYGGAGANTFVFNRGDGIDAVYRTYDSEADNIEFGAGIAPDDLELTRSDSNLSIRLRGTEEGVCVYGLYSAADALDALTLRFSDGQTLTGAQVDELIAIQPATAFGDIIDGRDGADIIGGGAGSDQLYGHGGDDRLSGGDDDDTIYGGSGYDSLSGDAGSDRLYGGAGNDTLTGGVGNDWLVGDEGDDELAGDRGDDVLMGGGGNNVFRFAAGFGHDTVSGAADETGRIIFDSSIDKADVCVSRSEDSLKLTLSTLGDSVVVSDWFNPSAPSAMMEVAFADGTVWTAATLSLVANAATPNDDYLVAKASGSLLDGAGGNDVLIGSDGNDTLIGGPGSDRLQGGGGADTYQFSRGYGSDIVIENSGETNKVVLGTGIATSDLVVTRTQYDLILSVNGTADRLTLSDWYCNGGLRTITELQFGDGTIWSADELARRVSVEDAPEVTAQIVVASATTGNDALFGSDFADTINAGSGNDVIKGNEGDDFLKGDSGNDTLDGGTGWDTLEGGAGSDVLEGDAGNDVYLFSRGSGWDTVIESDWRDGNQDAIRYDGTVSASEVSVRRDGDDLILGVSGTSDKVVVNYWFSSPSYRVESIVFADGTSWGTTTIKDKSMIGTAASEVLVGDERDNTISGLGGNDAISGEDGDDSLDGGSGNDSLDGGSGDDTLDGGAGADTLFAGMGSNTVVFGRGSGSDSLYGGTNAYEQTVLELKSGVAASDLVVTRDEQNLYVSIAGTTDKLCLLSWFVVGQGKECVAAVRFASGMQWTPRDLEDRLALAAGTSGNDTIYGSRRSDSIDGFSGNDGIYADDGDDTVIGGAGGDYLYGGYGSDSLNGGIGDDELAGWYGDDKLLGDAGRDVLNGDVGQDTLDGGAGNDTLDGGEDSDTYIFGRGYGVDYISDGGWAGTDVDTLSLLSGISSDDLVLECTESEFRIAIKGTTDQIVLDHSTSGLPIERIQFADGTVWGADFLYGESLRSTEGPDTIRGGDPSDLILGAGGDDELHGGLGHDTLNGGTGNDVLYGDMGADKLEGDEGDDTLNGGEARDLLHGGAGNDSLFGNLGDDIYDFKRGDAQDTIYDISGADEIQFASDIAPADVLVSRDEANLYLRIKGTSDRLTLSYWYFSGLEVERALFADGTVWGVDRLALAASTPSEYDNYLVGTGLADSLVGLGGNDTLMGGDANDTLDGGTGNDRLDGGTGNDDYVFAPGDGKDVIVDSSGIDRIRIAGAVAKADIVFWRDVSNLYIGIAGANDALSLADWFVTPEARVESIEFSDGSRLTTEDMSTAEFRGTSGADSLIGTVGDDVIRGLGGDDVLSGDEGDDTLDGGAGNDTLSGGSGNDSYLFGRESGQDVVDDSGNPTANGDSIVLQPGIAPADVRLSRDAENLFVGIYGTTDRLTVGGWFIYPNDRLRKLQFADGTTWSEEVLKTAAYFGTDDADVLYGSTLDDAIVGLGGNDFIGADAGNDRLEGGAGDDTLEGGEGDDTYEFSLADGRDVISDSGGNDEIKLGMGITRADVSFWRDASHLYIDIGVNVGIVVNGWFDSMMSRVESIRFSDGLVVSAVELEQAEFRGTNDADTMYGTTSNDILKGFGGNDDISGDAGNDTLDGGTGSDTLSGAAGNDVYVFGRGYGQDYVAESDATVGNVDTVLMNADVAPADIVLWRDASNLYVGINGTSDMMTLQSWYDDPAYRVEKLKFVDGTVWDTPTLAAAKFVGTDDADYLSGTIGNDMLDGRGGNDDLFGDAGNDTLDGGAGNDNLDGAAGNDVYLFGIGSGQDAVADGSGSDVIKLGAGVTTANVQLWRDTSNLYLGIIDTNDMLTVQGWFDATSNRVESVLFIDGTVWNAAALAAAAFGGTSGADTLYGTTGNNMLYGFGGNDALYGDAGQDTLDGGTGNDTLDGGTGNDTFMFVRGYGQDVIAETSGTDVVQFGNSIAPTDVMVSRDVSNLYLNLLGTSDKIVIQNWYVGSGYQVEQLKFADGTIWTPAYIAAKMTTATEGGDFLWGSTSNDTIDGLGGDDQVIGNEGNDSLIGGGGNDTLDGGVGNDTLVGGVGDDVYVVDTITDVVTEAADGGVDRVQSSITLTLAVNVENLTLTGAAAINGTGNTLANGIAGNDAANSLIGGAGNDTLTGFAGNDTLDGGAGADVLAGGLDDDTYIVDSLDDLITENDSEGTDTISAAFSYTLGANIERLTLTGSAAAAATGNELNNTLTGNSGANVLTGNAGNDALNGGAGADTMSGGVGNDTYTVDNGGDVVNENAGEGSDLVNSSIAYTLGANVEKLTLTGSSTINGTGNELDNVLTGNSVANTLTGGAGNDTLNGGTGIDTLIGGIGNDTYVVDTTTDVITENAGEGTDTVQSSVTYTLGNNLEGLTLTGTTAINGVGNTLDNVLTGNAAVNSLTGGVGNDTLNGGGGADVLIGGTGNDTYYVDNASDAITENASEGTDTVNSSLAWTLGANQENLTLTGTTAINGTGTTLDNVLTGNSGVNTLTGNAGNDTLDGVGGNDILIGGAGNDTYVLGRGYGNDTVQENDATAGNTDIAQFLSGVATDQIWFRHVGNNLEARIIGTSDKLTVENWYTSTAYQVEQFKTADGKLLLNTQVETLVQAMAAFSPPAAGQTTLPQNYQDALAPVIAANWH